MRFLKVQSSLLSSSLAVSSQDLNSPAFFAVDPQNARQEGDHFKESLISEIKNPPQFAGLNPLFSLPLLLSFALLPFWGRAQNSRAAVVQSVIYNKSTNSVDAGKNSKAPVNAGHTTSANDGFTIPVHSKFRARQKSNLNGGGPPDLARQLNDILTELDEDLKTVSKATTKTGFNKLASDFEGFSQRLSEAMLPYSTVQPIQQQVYDTYEALIQARDSLKIAKTPSETQALSERVVRLTNSLCLDSIQFAQALIKQLPSEERIFEDARRGVLAENRDLRRKLKLALSDWNGKYDGGKNWELTKKGIELCLNPWQDFLNNRGLFDNFNAGSDNNKTPLYHLNTAFLVYSARWKQQWAFLLTVFRTDLAKANTEFKSGKVTSALVAMNEALSSLEAAMKGVKTLLSKK